MEDHVSFIDIEQVKDFQKNPVWEAFVQVIEDRIELVRNELEVGVAKVLNNGKVDTIILTHEGVAKRQGECAGLRYLLQLPQIIVEIKEQDKQKKEKKEE